MPLSTWIIVGCLGYVMAVLTIVVYLGTRPDHQTTPLDHWLMYLVLPLLWFSWLVKNLFERPMIYLIGKIINCFEKKPK